MNEQRTVMVVDDDESIREFVEWALTEEGYRVLGAADGAAGLSITERLHPDLILLDLRMPGMDGAAFASAYRELPGPHAPIVVTTATNDGQAAAQIGAAEHLDKPFDLEDLLAVVVRYTTVRR